MPVYSQMDFAGLFLVFIRVGLIVSFLPGLQVSFLSIRTKLIISIMLTMVIFPVVEVTSMRFERDTGQYVVNIWQEFFVGFLLGAILRMVFYALNISGSFIGQLTSLSHLVANGNTSSAPIFANFLDMAAIALIFLIGAHISLIDYIIYSFDLFPSGGQISSGLVYNLVVSLFSHTLYLAVELSLPFVIISIIYNLMLGVLNRAMPQLMIVLIGAPLISLVSLWSFAILAGSMLSVWILVFQSVITGGFFQQ